MDSARWIGVAVAAAAAIFVLLLLRDPHRTALPVGSTDLAPLRAPLARLKPDERDLVLEYVQRSHGDVLPTRFADPNDPLTARTFGEAIALERKWREKQSVAKAATDARAAQRALELAPLRAIVTATVAKRELVSQADLIARQNGGAASTVPADDSAKRAQAGDAQNIFAATIELENLEDSDVVELSGAVVAQDRDSPLPFEVCAIKIDERQYVPVRGRREVLCANPDRRAMAQQTAFVEDPGRFSVSWEPHHVRLRNGLVLDADPR